MRGRAGLRQRGRLGAGDQAETEAEQRKGRRETREPWGQGLRGRSRERLGASSAESDNVEEEGDGVGTADWPEPEAHRPQGQGHC